MIKNFEEFNKTNESVAITTLATIGVLIKALAVYKTYHGQLKNSTRDHSFDEEIKSICGYNFPIFSLDVDKKNSQIACATINKVYYDKSLKEYLSHRELIAVILHEIGHIKNKNIIKSQIISIFPFIPVVMLSSWLVYLLLPIVNNILLGSPYKRRSEYDADSFANKYGYGEELLSALVKVNHHFLKDRVKATDKDYKNTIKYKIVSKLVSLLASHPSLNERISKLYDKENPESFIKRIEKEIVPEPSIKDRIASLYKTHNLDLKGPERKLPNYLPKNRPSPFRQ